MMPILFRSMWQRSSFQRAIVLAVIGIFFRCMPISRAADPPGNTPELLKPATDRTASSTSKPQADPETSGPAAWFQPFPAHRIIGNLYYVGSKDLACYLITTLEGHILINSGFERTVPLVRKSVESLGFKMSDIKILLASHAHSDHVAGLARLKEMTGAKVCIMRGDDKVISSGGEGQYLYTTSRWKPCAVDRVLADGDEVTLGGMTLTARLTPGHTRGCTTWTFRVIDAGKTYNVVIIGSPNVNPGYRLIGNKEYPEIANDFARTFEVLKSLPCDVFLGAHGEYYGMVEKYERAKKGTNANPFLDSEGYKAYIAQKEKAFREALAAQR